MPSSFHKARAVALPVQAHIAPLYPGAFLADAYAIDLPPSASSDALVLARFVVAQPLPWVDHLMALRDRLVAGFGLKTTRAMRAGGGDTHGGQAGGAQRVGIFKLYQTLPNEVVLGEDDHHLDFRISVLRRPKPDGGWELLAVTAVHCHNLLGRNYIRLIAPFHRAIVRAMLERAARAGWPGSTNSDQRQA